MWWRVFVFAGLLLVLGGTLEGCRRGPHLPSPPPVPTPTPVEVVTPPILATPSPTPVPLPSPSPTFSTTPTPTPHSLPKQGGILRTAQMGSPPTCDLRTYEGRSYLAVFPCSPMLNQLAKYTHQEQIAPDLAEGWEVQGGGKIWVFRLRDAQWHDGKPVTAEDVQYSLATVLTPPEGMRTGAPSTLRPYIAQIETPDPKTVVFRLKFPAPSFLPNLASVYVSIYAKHILTHMVPPTPSTPDYVVGSGPFQFRRWLPGSFIELERNPRYFLKDRPYLDGYTIYFIPDALSRFAALRTRQIDMLMADSMARGEVEEVLGHPRLREQISVESHPSNTFATLQVNTRSAHPTPPTGETVDWRDIRLRQAVNLAIDRYVVRTALYGDMGAFGSLLPPYSPWGLAEEEVLRMPGMAPTGPTKEAERTQARALLAQAGFPNGFSVTLLAPDLPT
ncbi:MAG: ABC transporter substrate-binding protein, partial [Dehalococcoidia bacterium]